MTSHRVESVSDSKPRSMLPQAGLGGMGADEGVDIIHKLDRGILLPFSFLLACVVIIVSLVFLSADRIDRYARQTSSAQVESLLELERSRLADLSLEYAWWNEAVEMMVYQRNMEWANTNVGNYLYSRYNLSWVFGLDRKGEFIYGRHGEDTLEELPVELVGSEVKSLIRAAADTDFEDPTPASAIMEFDGKPAFVSVASFTVYAPTEYEVDQSHGVLILVKELDEDLIASWSSDYQIDDLTFAEGENNHLDKAFSGFASRLLQSPGGQPIGELLWRPDRAGKAFLSFLLPWVLAVSLVVIICSFIFYRKLKAYSGVARSNIITLSINREMLVYQANFDHLTDLANRALFTDRVTHELAHCIRHRVKAAVLYIDLDGFKNVNDTMGHDCGDELLRQVGVRLTDLVRQEDTVSRFGGDEFCVLLSGLEKEGDVDVVVRKIHGEMSKPFLIENKQSFVGASVGVVVIPDDADNVSDVVRYADIAMYQAKSRGENKYCYYKPEFDRQSQHRAMVKNLLHSAIDNDELYLLYQPVYSLEDNAVVCVEALIRWRSHQLGLVSPMEFIPIAEETDVIHAIGLWVLERALIDIKKINQAEGKDVRVSVNVSVKQFRNSDFLVLLEQLLERHSVDRSAIQLEITENLLINNNEGEHNMLIELAKAGIKLVLDDFGTGYSSLSYLQRYPLETIKIDKSFVSGGQEKPQNKVLVKTIVYMANSFGMSTVAEGIETREQEAFMRSIGCTYGQGYWYSKPTSVDNIIRLKDQSTVTHAK